MPMSHRERGQGTYVCTMPHEDARAFASSRLESMRDHLWYAHGLAMPLETPTVRGGLASRPA